MKVKKKTLDMGFLVALAELTRGHSGLTFLIPTRGKTIPRPIQINNVVRYFNLLDPVSWLSPVSDLSFALISDPSGAFFEFLNLQVEESNAERL